jgi:hypothetical protein
MKLFLLYVFPRSSVHYLHCRKSLPSCAATIRSTIVLTKVTLQLPFWALVSFGAYLLFKLGYGVFTFNDVPEAYKELMGEIEQAKAELRTKGVDVD